MWEEAKKLAGVREQTPFVIIMEKHPFAQRLMAIREQQKKGIMRTVVDHKLNGLNDALNIDVMDAPGHGGACHRYEITGFDTKENPSSTNSEGYQCSFSRGVILFQNGPIKENGVNGISQEALLAVVIDRLRSFQAGPYACRENAIALTKIEEAMMWLKKRTQDRMARGVEGTSVK